MKKLITMLFFVLYCLGFSAIFTEKDSVNVFHGIETTRSGGIVGIEYIVPTMRGAEIGVSTQFRILNNKNNYVSNSLTYYYEVFKPAKEKVPIYTIIKVGIASDLDSRNDGLYVGGGVQYGRDKFVRILAETEDSEFRTSVGFGMKIKSIN